MRGLLPELQALETVVADTQRIQSAIGEGASEHLEAHLQTAADNLRRLFGYKRIDDIVDNGTVQQELLELKAVTVRALERDAHLSEFMNGGTAESVNYTSGPGGRRS